MMGPSLRNTNVIKYQRDETKVRARKKPDGIRPSGFGLFCVCKCCWDLRRDSGKEKIFANGESKTDAKGNGFRKKIQRLEGEFALCRIVFGQSDTKEPIKKNNNTRYFCFPKNGYAKCVGGQKVSFTVLGDVQRIRFKTEPALSLVPEALAPPKGCWPTTAPVGLSLM